MFHRNVVSPLSGWKRRSSKNSGAVEVTQQVTVLHRSAQENVTCLLELAFGIETAGSTTFQNIREGSDPCSHRPENRALRRTFGHCTMKLSSNKLEFLGKFASLISSLTKTVKPLIHLAGSHLCTITSSGNEKCIYKATIGTAASNK
jgi:hypothetical protein